LFWDFSRGVSKRRGGGQKKSCQSATVVGRAHKKKKGSFIRKRRFAIGGGPHERRGFRVATNHQKLSPGKEKKSPKNAF